MTDRAKKYLSDILQAILLIEAFTAEVLDFDAYASDLKTKSAVERQLSIIGEAANRFRKEDTSFVLSNARQIVDFRNWIIHAYANIDDAIVWVILKNNLPKLKKEVEAGLEK